MKKIHYIFSTAVAACLMFAACQSLDEPAPTAPDVTTPDMAEVGATYAVFSTVTISGTASSCYFYMSESSDMSTATKVSEGATVTSLTPSSTYYYKACATDGYTELYGSVKSFTTDNQFYIASVDSIGVDGSSSKFSAINSDADVLGALVEFTPSGEDSYFLSDIGNEGGIYISRSGAGDDETWTLSEDIPMSTGTYQFYAYYPYSDYVTAEEPLLYFYILKQGSLAWGTSGSVSSSTSAVSIEMQEMLATINISVSCEGRTVEYMYIANAGHAFPAYGYFDVTTGEFIYPSEDPYDYDIITYQISGSSSFTDSQECTYRTFPATFGDEDLMLTIWFDDGTYVSTYFPSDSWGSGDVFSYEAYVEPEEEEATVVLTLVDTSINDWKDGGSTEVDFEVSD